MHDPFEFLPARIQLQVKENNLTIDDIALVQKEIWDGRSKWCNLGLELGLSVGTLDAIKLREQGDPENCLRESLKEWLRNPECPSSWNRLAESLRAPTVGLGDLADHVVEKYCSN